MSIMKSSLNVLTNGLTEQIIHICWILIDSGNLHQNSQSSIFKISGEKHVFTKSSHLDKHTRVPWLLESIRLII